MNDWAHVVWRLQRIARADWAVHCTCGRSFDAVDPIRAHRLHQDHVIAEFLAGELEVDTAVV